MAHEIEVIVKAPVAGGKSTVAGIIAEALTKRGMNAVLHDEDLIPDFYTDKNTARRVEALNVAGVTVKVVTKQPPRVVRVNTICFRDSERVLCVAPGNIASLERLPASAEHPACTVLRTTDGYSATFTDSEAEFAAAVEAWSLHLTSKQ